MKLRHWLDYLEGLIAHNDSLRCPNVQERKFRLTAAQNEWKRPEYSLGFNGLVRWHAWLFASSPIVSCTLNMPMSHVAQRERDGKRGRTIRWNLVTGGEWESRGRREVRDGP